MGTFVMEAAQQKAYTTIIRVPKQEAAYTYFILEASEGFCFYSTIDESLGEGYRDIELVTPIKFKQDIDLLLAKLGTQYKVEIIDEYAR
ncbi:MAG: hypothetical protein HN730_11665 [Bdellovibrionales bacterium]|nr:hypothetical protein [Bdellovibrionales bacterium]